VGAESSMVRLRRKDVSVRKMGRGLGCTPVQQFCVEGSLGGQICRSTNDEGRNHS